MGREEGYRGASSNNTNSSSNSGTRASWPLARPSTSRGGATGGDNHVSPMLRPRKGQSFSHSVTPSPTFPAQSGVRKNQGGIYSIALGPRYDNGTFLTFYMFGFS